MSRLCRSSRQLVAEVKEKTRGSVPGWGTTMSICRTRIASSLAAFPFQGVTVFLHTHTHRGFLANANPQNASLDKVVGPGFAMRASAAMMTSFSSLDALAITLPPLHRGPTETVNESQATK